MSEQQKNDLYDSLYDRMMDAGQDVSRSSMEEGSRTARQIINQGSNKLGKEIRKAARHNRASKRNTNQALRGAKRSAQGISRGSKATTQGAKATIKGVRGTSSAVSKGVRGAGRLIQRLPRIIHNTAKAMKALGKAAVDIGKLLVKFVAAFWKEILIVLAIILVVVLIIGIVNEISSSKGVNENYYTDGNQVVGERSGVDNETGKRDVTITLDSTNAAIKAYYELMAEKSVWQLQSDGTLINATDDNALSDYFNRDDNMQVNPNFLYALNEYFYGGESLVYPEQFIKPVAYDKDTMTLASLVDDNGKILVESSTINLNTGESKGTTKALSDYGFGTIACYKKESLSTSIQGTYVSKEVWDDAKSEIVEETISEAFSIALESKEIDVLDKAITFAGEANFGYTKTNQLSTPVTDGESTVESDNVKRIKYADVEVTLYSAKDKAGNTVTDKTKAWCDANGYTVTDKGTKKTVSLYKTRSDASGIYSNTVVPMDSSSAYNDKGLTYYYDYVTRFTGYIPTFMSRTYDMLSGITGTASTKNYDTSTKSSGSTSSTAYVQEYIDLMTPIALEMQKESGISAAIIIAQGALESGWGTSKLATEGKNYFGIKAGSNWTGKTWSGKTQEVYDGQRVTITDAFRAYDDPADSARDYCKLIWNGYYSPGNYRYRDAVGKSYREAITAIRDGGYCTEDRETYINGVCDIIENNNLASLESDPAYQWDGTTPDYADGTSNGGNNASSNYAFMGGLSENDKAIFSNFISAYSEDITLDYPKGTYNAYRTDLTTDEMQNLLITTLTFNNHTYTNEESLADIDLWSDGFVGVSSDNASETGSYYGEGDFIWVTPGNTTITSYFGPRSASATNGIGSTDHKGIDIGLSVGDDVVASREGKVIVSQYDSGAGNYIVIEHDEGFKTVYMHNSKLLVSVGEQVSQGQVIAKGGNTGNSTGPHLHFGISLDGEYVDPLLYVDPNGTVSKNKGGKNVDTSQLTNLKDASKLRQDMVAFALQFVGNPYVYGGNSLTNGIDCSGFTKAIYEHFGMTIPRTAASQKAAFESISEKNLQPGDLLFYKDSNGGIGHVTMYIGNGKVVHASSSKTGIIVSNIGYRQPCGYGRCKAITKKEKSYKGGK